MNKRILDIMAVIRIYKRKLESRKLENTNAYKIIKELDSLSVYQIEDYILAETTLRNSILETAKLEYKKKKQRLKKNLKKIGMDFKNFIKYLDGFKEKRERKNGKSENIILEGINDYLIILELILDTEGLLLYQKATPREIKKGYNNFLFNDIKKRTKGIEMVFLREKMNGLFFNIREVFFDTTISLAHKVIKNDISKLSSNEKKIYVSERIKYYKNIIYNEYLEQLSNDPREIKKLKEIAIKNNKLDVFNIALRIHDTPNYIEKLHKEFFIESYFLLDWFWLVSKDKSKNLDFQKIKKIIENGEKSVEENSRESSYKEYRRYYENEMEIKETMSERDCIKFLYKQLFFNKISVMDYMSRIFNAHLIMTEYITFIYNSNILYEEALDNEINNKKIKLSKKKFTFTFEVSEVKKILNYNGIENSIVHTEIKYFSNDIEKINEAYEKDYKILEAKIYRYALNLKRKLGENDYRELCKFKIEYYNFLNDIMKSPKNLIIYGLGNIRILEMLEQLYIIE
ncbi:hypothetical protein AAA294_03355 [Fusobacterium varium]|uniref:hypothetical protein n=1 Tax=Fusobacterium varium TaxID=856 RepID=UPI0032C1C656